MKKILFPILILVLPIISLSQNESKWNVQLSGGSIVSFGDVTDHSLFAPSFYNDDAWKPGGAAVLGYSLSRSMGLRMQLKYGEIGGSNKFIARYFRGTVMEASLQLKLNINEIFGNNNSSRSLNLYSLLGVGISSWNTEDGISGTISHNPLEFEERTNKEFMPAGLGLSYRLSNNFDLNLEGLVNITNSDILDKVEEGSKFDKYTYTSLGLTYKFGSGTSRDQTKDKDHIVDTTGTSEEDQQRQAEQPKEEKSRPVEVTLDSDMPSEIDADESFNVTIRVNKGNLDGAATLRQIFPKGMNVQPLFMGGGEYNFMNEVFTINWQNLPKSQPSIKIKYFVRNENMESGKYSIDGVFIYTQNNNSRQIKFKNSLKVDVPDKAEEETEKQEEREEIEKRDKKQKSETKDRIKQSRVVFRVQIRAKYQAKLSKSALKNRLNLNETIYEDFHNGYFIYTVGNFSSFKTAENKREQLINQHGLNEAFIIAFKNGKRIELEELEQF